MGLGLHQGGELLQGSPQLLQGLLIHHLTEARQQTARQRPHQGAQAIGGGLRQQRRAQHRIGRRRLHQRQAHAGGQGGVGPVFEQQHLGALGGIGGQQRRLGRAALQVVGDGGGVGDHLSAVHQHGHLALTRQLQQRHLAHTGGDLHHGVVEPLGRQDQAHLLAEGGMAELMEFEHRRRGGRGEASGGGCGPAAAE